jgi:signal peptidase I
MLGGEQQQQQQNEFYFFRVLLYRLAVAYGSIYCISEYGFQLTNCNGPSMLPTLKPVAEIIFVDRLTPRLFGMDGGSTAEGRIKIARKRQRAHPDVDVWHHPFIPANRLPKERKWERFFTSLRSGVNIGDVVVVEHPQREGTICKRVIGLPGDEIILKKASYSEAKRRGLLKVPDGHLWLEGDNSANSLDSRTYGPVPAAMIVGRVPFRVWPLRGNAMIERGMRPTPRLGEPLWGAQGSTVLPAGYQGETINKGDTETEPAPKSKNKRRKSSM